MTIIPRFSVPNFEKQQGVRRKQALLEARSDVDVQDKGPELRV